MNVRLITGSFPPDICGVGDYTKSLQDSLKKKDVNVRVSVLTRITSTEVLRLALRHKALNEIIHIQYPTVGYGHGLEAQLLSLLRPAVVTLHEFSRVHPLRQLASLPFMCRSQIIFTSTFELNFATRLFPLIRNRSCVIPIGSNITSRRVKWHPNLKEIVYFGLIVPKKGLESVLQLANLLQAAGDDLNIRIIGATLPGYRDYADKFIRSCDNLPITLSLNQSAEQIGELIGSAGCAYLPFPDGASERRGSMKAVLAAGLPCITTTGTQITEPISNAVCIAQTPFEALLRIKEILFDRQRWLHFSNNALIFSETYDWNSIADKHIHLYQQLLNTPPANPFIHGC